MQPPLGNILGPAMSLFLLRELPFTHYTFPRWQAWLALALIGLLVGLDPAIRSGAAGMPTLPLWLAVAVNILLMFLLVPLVVWLLRLWLKRGGRWDGQGDLFNLLVASWLLPDTLGAGLIALGLPPLLAVPLWLYSIWVSANAIAGPIPRVGLGYAIVGVILSMIVAGLLYGLALGGLLAVAGFVPAGA